MKKLTYNLLYQEYHLNNQTLRQIAEKYNFNHKTVLKYLRIFNIPVKKGNRDYVILSNKLYTQKEWLSKQYKIRTASDMAKDCSVHSFTIRKWLRYHGIKIRNASECRKGKFHSEFKGNSFISNGYRMIYSPNNPRCKKKESNYLAEHILFMEKYLGRHLTSSEQIHHKNGNKLNNSLNNLKLFPSSSKHIKYEMLLGDFAKKLLFSNTSVSNKSELLQLFNKFVKEHK